MTDAPRATLNFAPAAVEVKDNRRVMVPLISPPKFKELYDQRKFYQGQAG